MNGAAGRLFWFLRSTDVTTHEPVLPNTARVTIDVLEPKKRPVSAVADFTEVRDVSRVHVSQARDVTLSLLFDSEHNLEERILNEQFSP